MRIVYMGTPDFAVASLEALIQAGYNIVGVVTQPDRPRGRGQKLHSPPVKVIAEKFNIPVYQPDKIKTPQFINELKDLKPDVIAVVAYGKILPPEILYLPPLGCINVHASLLPKYRGSAPIHWAIINGEQETGITTMHMDEGMDTGDMILTATTQIGTNDTVGELHDVLAEIGAKLLTETISLIGRGEAPRTAQDDTDASYAPMLTREHELIVWHQPAKTLHNQVRGMNPWPGTYTTWQGKILKIWRTEIIFKQTSEKPGTVVACNNDEIIVQTGENCLALREIQLQGSRRLACKDFLCGNKVEFGICLGE